MPERPCQGAVMGIDFGARRTGVAIADFAVAIAHPLDTVRTSDDAERLRLIGRLVAEWQPVMFVVGMPVAEGDAEHALAPTVRAFAAELARRFVLPVEFEDERFTSHAASLSLATAGVRGARQKAHLDSFAAKEILQGFLDGAHATA
ncbi:MAG: Holliday junction resolvase RuvX [Burkholderiales bacterium]